MSMIRSMGTTSAATMVDTLMTACIRTTSNQCMDSLWANSINIHSSSLASTKISSYMPSREDGLGAIEPSVATITTNTSDLINLSYCSRDE